MAALNEVFERIEKKYRLNACQRQRLQPYLEEHMALDSYGEGTVTSIYLDTAQSDLICRSLEKPLYKEKIRIRHYGKLSEMDSQSEVFLEVKKKFEGVVYKRRVCMTWAAVQAFLEGLPYEKACQFFPLGDPCKAAGSVSTHSRQIARELSQSIRFYGPLQCSMALACERRAYVRCLAPTFASLLKREAGVRLMDWDDSLRITFDDHIRYCQLGEGDLQEQRLLSEGECIMEVKAIGAMPLWLTRAFSECGIKPVSFSKYGEAFKACQMKKE